MSDAIGLDICCAARFVYRAGLSVADRRSTVPSTDYTVFRDDHGDSANTPCATNMGGASAGTAVPLNAPAGG
jgi:hypothetical protein